ncbi:MAG TPA: HNH endonuclease, partial [Stenomitos sp.]
SPSTTMRIPQAIRLLVKAVVHKYFETVRPTRQAVFKRDKHMCQYCGSRGELTLDHIHPRSRGGEDTWENLVTACQKCNNRKGDRRPDEAGMVLNCVPRAPRMVEIASELWSKLMGW